MKTVNTRHSFSQMLTVMFISSLLAAPAWASDVTYSTADYQTGDTLTASGLNTKFNDIKTSVDDNNSQAATNANNITTLNDNIVGAGANPGDMQYWNGTAWVLVPAPTVVVPAGAPANVGAILHFCNGVPTWGTCLAIGDTGPAGGIIFYIDATGVHGLEAAPDDQSIGAVWCAGTLSTGAVGTAIGTGAQNTAGIYDWCFTIEAGTGDVFRVTKEYTLNGYHGWFLPSKDELNLMYTNLKSAELGGFVNDNYWNSSELDIDNTWYQSFADGSQNTASRSASYRVRVVRAF